MSKAFTKEPEDEPEPRAIRLGVPVPEPNYMTPAGARAARSELATCSDAERGRELSDHLASAQVIEPPSERDTVGLGATVTVEDESGKRTTYRIVGALEADARRGMVFWQTPVAQALWAARVGDTVALPRGEVEIVAIDYE
jgi:transcription elongation GreA/GreB family factor